MKQSQLIKQTARNFDDLKIELLEKLKREELADTVTEYIRTENYDPYDMDPAEFRLDCRYLQKMDNGDYLAVMNDGTALRFYPKRKQG